MIDSNDFKSSGDIFNCEDDSNMQISASKVNDDYCDCPNGRDEPSTSACSFLLDRKFYCNNFGYKSVEIPYSRVNDGVCDCCDGSDEHDTPTLCVNRCQELGETYRKEKENEQRLIEIGKRKRLEYIESAKNANFDKSDNLAKAEVELAENKAEIELLEQQLNSLQQKREVDEVTKAEARIKSLKIHDLPRDELEFMLVLLADYSGLGLKLEHMVRDALEEYKSDKEDSSEDDYNDYYDPYAEGGTDGPYWIDDDEVCESLQRSQDENDEEESSEDETELHCSSGNSNNGQIQEIRRKIEVLEKEKRKLERTKTSHSKDAKKDFGPENVFYKLNDKCFDKQIMQYKYTICLYGQAKQDKTNLGKYSSLEIADDGEISMIFDKGTRCHNKVQRSMKVRFKCGESEDIGEIKEPSMCEYEAEFYTPAAC